MRATQTSGGLERLELGLSPWEAACRLRHRPGCVFLDSAVAGGDHRLSVLASDPEGECRDWPGLRAALARWGGGAGVDLGMPDGALIGWVTYEGEVRFGIYPDLLVYDHLADAWWGSPRALARLREVEGRGGPVTRFEPGGFRVRPIEEMDRGAFVDRVRRAQEYIAAGDIYQVNLSRRFSGGFEGDAFGYYAALREASPAPHAAWLDFGEVRVASASPETFLRMDGQRIVTRPIKGTRPRRSDPAEDERSAYDLITSPKEVAELVMITDLERNDLGQVCEFGSVRVRELLRLERFEQVFHLVSTVEGTLRPGISQVDAFEACFPGGSITGAPKRRAREIIAELEPVSRGLYTGAIGWFGFNGDSRFSIAIRTALLDGAGLRFHAGAGIVADSDPESEFRETAQKALGLLRAAGVPDGSA